MTQVKINDSVLRKAAEAGMDEFVQAFVDAIRNALGGELNAQNMAELNSDQITLSFLKNIFTQAHYFSSTVAKSSICSSI